MSEFDLSQCTVYLLTGDHDYSVTSILDAPGQFGGRRSGDDHVRLGAVPMTGNLHAFRPGLIPIPNELREVRPKE